jgi:hypothetical protein
MNKKELFKQVNKVCCDLDNKYNINCGGCCYVAACIAEQLELKGIPFKVIHYNLYSCHFAIKVSDRYLNRCDYRKKEITKIPNWTSKDLYSHYNKEDWNKCYNPKDNRTVKNSIKSIFSKYENRRT